MNPGFAWAAFQLIDSYVEDFLAAVNGSNYRGLMDEATRVNFVPTLNPISCCEDQFRWSSSTAGSTLYFKGANISLFLKGKISSVH
jgi:hypothetical protein